MSGKQSVTATGDLPAAVTFAYEQSGTRSGQLTEGNTASLVLGGYDGVTIEKIVLTMHSNTSKGAGSATVTIGGEVLAAIADSPFSDNRWAGGFSTDWVEVVLFNAVTGLVMPEGEEITITITSSQNSLYIQSFAVYYSEEPASLHTVCFKTYLHDQQIAPLTEAYIGAGVILPQVPIADENWVFYGWAEQPVVEGGFPPSVNFAGVTYFPDADITLHAVYAHYAEQSVWYPADSVSTGAYLICRYLATGQTLLRACSSVNGGYISMTEEIASCLADEPTLPLITSYMEEEVYQVISSGENSIRLYHRYTNSPINCTGGGTLSSSLSASTSWSVQPEDTSRCFVLSSVGNSSLYYLSLWLRDNGYFVLRSTNKLNSMAPLLFYSLDDYSPAQSAFTSYPYGNSVSVASIEPHTTSYDIDMGAYILRISEGRKTMILR